MVYGQNSKPAYAANFVGGANSAYRNNAGASQVLLNSHDKTNKLKHAYENTEGVQPAGVRSSNKLEGLPKVKPNSIRVVNDPEGGYKSDSRERRRHVPEYGLPNLNNVKTGGLPDIMDSYHQHQPLAM